MNSPYREDQEHRITEAKDLFGSFRVIPTKKRQSERGEILRYFSQKTGRPIPFLAHKLTGLEMTDLYFLKSSCDGYEREGKGPWGKAFWGSLKVREV